MPARSRTRWPISAAIVVVVLSGTPPLGARPKQAPATAPGNCVSIGTPKPNLSYTYRYSDSVGGSSEFTDRWEQFTTKGSRLQTTKSSAKGQES
jgi:hypothetical protein